MESEKWLHIFDDVGVADAEYFFFYKVFIYVYTKVKGVLTKRPFLLLPLSLF